MSKKFSARWLSLRNRQKIGIHFFFLSLYLQIHTHTHTQSNITQMARRRGFVNNVALRHKPLSLLPPHTAFRGRSRKLQHTHAPTYPHSLPSSRDYNAVGSSRAATDHLYFHSSVNSSIRRCNITDEEKRYRLTV